MAIDLVYYGGFKLPDLKARGVHAVLSCASLAAAGVPVTLCLRAGPEDPTDALAPYGLEPPDGLRIRAGRHHWLGRLLGKGAGLKALTLGALRPEAHTVKIAYTMDYPGLRVAPRLLRYRRLLGYRFVFELHNLTHTVLREEADRWADRPERHRQLMRRARAAERTEAACYPRLDGVVANSRGTLEAAATAFGLPERRLTLANGVDLERFRVTCAEPDVDLVYTGSLDGWKGVDVLIDALARLEGVRLRIAGFGEPPVVERVLARARDRGVRERVDFVGYRPHHEIPEVLARARAVVVSTSGRYREGRRFTCPMKLLEAMAAGKPVVATDLPSIRELVTPEREGLLFRDDDPESLAAAVRRVLADPALATRLGHAGRVRAESFTWSARARRLIAFLEAVAAGSPAA